ncbi:ribosomal protein S18-alanine N-acetyltransferase [Microcella humidisoli]|uniref:[Ribosomal protein bS18]-alanine N-acetyltransferase n=1 Tax=Microcella humidisoli TaxID=2963406 RepID=A0ABY5FSY7_9MICO|nr:ribosomal protein S18-alanine N-acetyltransferase [Microcella humidisoli]UTT61403.1 ribosomal protein S18-alanine N-acetyltransferase [Microcella humidisoli]
MQADQVQLRDADLDDLDAIMALEIATFPSDAWSREMMAAELAAPHTRYLVALVGEAIVGYAGLSAPVGATQADIQTIAVDGQHRRLGIGALLVARLLDEARVRRVDDVLLEVRADNPGAQRLYERHGFAPIAVRPRYYQPDDVDAIVMRWEAGS